MAPQFRQIIKPAQVSGLSMTLPNGIRIGLEGMSMEDLSRLCSLYSGLTKRGESLWGTLGASQYIYVEVIF
jgi:hypothetical protein